MNFVNTTKHIAENSITNGKRYVFSYLTKENKDRKSLIELILGADSTVIMLPATTLFLL